VLYLGVLMADLTEFKLEIEQAMVLTDTDAAFVAVCAACANALPGDGAAITIMTSDSKRETVFSRDQVVADFERLQYNVGEGPSLLAFSTDRPVLVADIKTPPESSHWPGFMGALDGKPIRGVFSFPMRFGVISVGVCTFYRREAGSLTAEELSYVLDVLDVTTLVLLELRDGQQSDPLLGRWLSVNGASRRQVHQATGMLIAQLGVSAEAAFARLRAYAFGQGTDIEQVASDIVNRRLRLEADRDPGAGAAADTEPLPG
jgi:ANTAR domain/GAF domain